VDAEVGGAENKVVMNVAAVTVEQDEDYGRQIGVGNSDMTTIAESDAEVMDGPRELQRR
jgi:hypothetical protein